MKRLILYRLCGALSLLAFCAACGLEAQDECLPCNDNKYRYTELRLEGALPDSGLETPLYLFRRAAHTQDGYVFSESYLSITDGQTLKIPLAELKAYDYRFLMVAQPDGGAWLELGTAAGTPLVAGVVWEDLRLASATGAAAEGYCGFTDMSGESILTDGKIRLTLTRIAGQMLFDIFRGSLAQPESIVSPDVASVIDRVASIDITYENPTSALRFDANGVLVPATYASQPLTQHIEPALTDLKVALPQSDKGLEVYDNTRRGSLRMKGSYLLPSDGKVHVKMVFTYHDTTPGCTLTHTHDPSCFPLREVTLNLPKAGSGTGLPVAADSYTVNRAGLRCDRIIDIPVGGGVETNFDWQ